jgi:O-antigen/teichoic acid export membrane protein
VVLLALGAPLVTRLAFGERFAPASAALAVLAPSLLLTYVATILATALLIQDRPWTVTWTNVATTASLPVLVVVFAPWVRSRIGLGGGALADACIFTLLEVVTVVRFVGVLGRRVWDPRLGRTLAVSACAALGAVAAHGIVNRFLAAGDGPLTPSRATVALLASAGTYALVALALRLARREDLAALRGLFRRGSRPT